MPASLARASLSHNWRRTWFTVTILMLAGVVIYVQLAASTAQLLSFGAVERQATAEIVVLTRLPGVSRPVFRDLKPQALAAIAVSSRVGAWEAIRERVLSIPMPSDDGQRRYLSAHIIEPEPPGLSAPRILTEEARALLRIPGGLLVTDIDARAHNLSLGDEIGFNGRSLRVLGLIRGGLGANNSLVSRDTAAASRRSAPAALLRRPIGVLVQPAEGVNAPDLVAELDAALAPFGAKAITRDQMVRDISSEILSGRTDIRGFLVIGLFMAVVTAVIVLQATNSSIAAQRTEFGILLALGVPRRRLAAVILEQAAWIGVLGAAFAVSGGLAAQVLLTQFDVAMAMQPVFIPLVSALLIASSVLGASLALPSAFAIKPMDLLR